ncbi:glycosyltransferase [Actinoplanes sp. NPDC051475]|uniref:glycosyltransferase n=1 Tax=Actinoplanes sp. NPDC051475 TaxID=3157225 RepID=UPI00344EA248
MRLLFICGGSPATVFALAPLATAARQAGHGVVVAATEDMVPVVTGAGLPAIATTPLSMRDLMFRDRAGQPLALPQDPQERLLFGGRGFGRLAAAGMPALAALTAVWRPDVVVGGTLAFAAGLLATDLAVPYVRHAWDLGEPAEMDLGAAAELEAELAARELAGLPEADLWIHLSPPSLLPPEAPPGRVMRYVPAGRQQRLESWMLAAPGDRPRVCVTAGSRAESGPELDDLLRLTGEVARTGAEVLVAAADAAAAALTAAHPGVRAGWLPLDTVLPTCDAIVHAGGGQTALTAIHAGVPQVLVPSMPKLLPHARRLAEAGAAMNLPAGEDGPGAVEAACTAILTQDKFRARSRELAAEMAALPGPAEVIGEIAGLRRR